MENGGESVALDVLSDVLAATRIRNSISSHPALTAPWGFHVGSTNRACFHIVSRGTCWVALDGNPDAVQLVQGDVVLLPHGAGHRLVDRPDTPVDAAGEGQATSSEAMDLRPAHAMDNASTVLVCGYYDFEHNAHHPLLALLPPLIHIPADEADGTSSLQTTIRLLTREICDTLPGSATVLSRLSDSIFVFIVRAWLDRQPERAAGWLGALRDAKVGAALSLIHAAPHNHWTVESLAGEVSMSRAAFARRFSELVGEPPLTYVTRWRMDIAARLLRKSDRPLISIARSVGYETESSFSKAFRRAFGVPPGHFRDNGTKRMLLSV